MAGNQIERLFNTTNRFLCVSGDRFYCLMELTFPIIRTQWYFRGMSIVKMVGMKARKGVCSQNADAFARIYRKAYWWWVAPTTLPHPVTRFGCNFINENWNTVIPLQLRVR